jgi:hypothetical protein
MRTPSEGSERIESKAIMNSDPSEGYCGILEKTSETYCQTDEKMMVDCGPIIFWTTAIEKVS